MRVAAAAYPLDWLGEWSDYAKKLQIWVEDAADNGAVVERGMRPVYR